MVEQNSIGRGSRIGRVEIKSAEHPSSDALDKFSRVMARAGVAEVIIAYQMDQVIFREGDRAENVYQVVRGAVRAYKHFSDGHRQIEAFHLPGQIFGLETSSIHSSTAEATIDTGLRVVSRCSIERAARLDAEVACELWSMTADKLRRTKNRIRLLGEKNASERLLSFLLEMDANLATGEAMELPMRRRDIADYLGLTLETVSRILTKLKRQRILAFSARGSRRIAIFKHPTAVKGPNGK